MKTSLTVVNAALQITVSEGELDALLSIPTYLTW